jgi:hypothetical protein
MIRYHNHVYHKNYKFCKNFYTNKADRSINFSGLIRILYTGYLIIRYGGEQSQKEGQYSIGRSCIYMLLRFFYAPNLSLNYKSVAHASALWSGETLFSRISMLTNICLFLYCSLFMLSENPSKSSPISGSQFDFFNP